MSKFKRRGIANMNKYQWQILLVIFIPMFVISLTNLISFNIFFSKVIKVFVDGVPSGSVDYLYTLAYSYLSVLGIFFLVLFLISVKFSSRMVGPYERLLREMDEVVEDGRTAPLKLRKNDAFFKDLVLRINKLIKGFSADTRE